MCLERELMHCSGDDVTLVQKSMQFVVEGYQANGRCEGITVGHAQVGEQITGKYCVGLTL